MEKEEVIEVMESYGLDATDFFDWMNGQTVGDDGFGKTDFYETDVTRYVNWKVYGKPYHFD